MFKLGKNRGNYASGGIIKTKMRFGKQAGGEGSVPGTPVIRMPLAEGVMGDATDMKIGKLSYTDDYIMYNGEKFERKDVNGVDSILVDGEWKEAGSHDFPWEEEANNGNDHGNI